MSRASTILRWTALAALLFTALHRAQSTRARLPYWDLDPTRVTIPETALLYSHGFLLDALVWLAAALTIVGESLAGRRIHWRSGILVLIGAVGVALHGYYLPPPGATPGGPLRGDFMGLALGSAWAAAMVGGWTILHLARDQPMRRAAALALFSFVAILVAKGAYQVYIEHAYTVSAYKKDPAAMLASQGLADGSTAAKEYERRLFQPEPVGWFGLSNVYATFVAASFIFFLGLSIGAWKLVKEKAITNGPAGALTLAALASLFGLYLSGSKGGWGAMLAGGIVLLIGFLSHSALRMGEVDGRSGPAGEGSVPTPSTSRSSFSGFFSHISPNAHRLLPIALCVATLAVVLTRGLIGERFTELSLLFRYHYLVAATRIFASDSLFGVGPMGFKNAYALHKVPINPEMVESPHSVFFDWAATLGAFGLCWCFVLIWLLLRVGSGLSASRKSQAASPPPWRSYAPVLAATALASIAAWAREFPIVTADEWPLRLIALVVGIAFVLIGMKVAALAPRAFTFSLAAAANVVAVHSMIEMTPTQPASCAWVLLVVVLAGADDARHPARAWGVPSGALAASVPLIAGLLVLAAPIPQARAIERTLSATAKAVSVLALPAGTAPDEYIPALRERFERVDPNLPLDQAIWLACGQTLDKPIAALRSLGRELADAYEPAIRMQMDALMYYRLVSRYPGDVRQESEQSTHLLLALAGDRERSVKLQAAVASAWAVMGDEWQSLSAWRRVTQLDPCSLTPALNAYRLARQINDYDTAHQMAELALRNNAYLRLDPLKQLDPSQVAELKAFLASETPNPT